MSTKKTSYPPITIGTSFMLVIFLILAMVVFAVLSLTSALKDQKHAEEHAARTSAYYDACSRAEEILAQSAADESAKDVVEYTVPIDEDEILRVQLTKGSQQQYRITSWTQEITKDWNSEQTLPVLGSEP